jgi:hypothetical protein
MSDCLHCDIHEMLESHLQSEQADLPEIAAKVTEVLADLILMAPPDEQVMMMADVVANLGGMVLEKSQEADSNSPRRSTTEAIAQEFRMTMLKVCALAARPDTIVASVAPEGHANSERSMQGSFNMRRDGCPSAAMSGSLNPSQLRDGGVQSRP